MLFGSRLLLAILSHRVVKFYDCKDIVCKNKIKLKKTKKKRTAMVNKKFFNTRVLCVCVCVCTLVGGGGGEIGCSCARTGKYGAINEKQTSLAGVNLLL